MSATTAAASLAQGVLHAEVRRGVRAAAPLLAAYLPFALTLGATIARHPDPLAAWAGTLMIFGGSAHLAVVQLSAAAAAAPIVVVTGLLIHARLAVYSLEMAGHWATEPVRRRLFGAALLIDPTWALGTERYRAPGAPGDKWRYHVGASCTIAIGWLVMVSAGAVVGGSLTDGTGVALAAPLCMVAMVTPRITDRTSVAAAVAGGAVAAVAGGLPAGTGLLAAIAAGTAAGIAAGGRER